MTANKAIDVLLQAGTDLASIMRENHDAEIKQQYDELTDAMAMGIAGLLSAIDNGLDGDAEMEETTMIDPIKLYAWEIRARVSDAELLAGAAEECMELAHALLKERRAIMQGENPTPVAPYAAYEKVVEELSDVSLYMQVLGFVPDNKIQLHKMNRWIERLNERECAE